MEYTLKQLLHAGQADGFTSIAIQLCNTFPDVRRLVERRDGLMSPSNRSEVTGFAMGLSEKDHIAFVKAVAVYEHCCGTFGSVTLLQCLLPVRLTPSDTRRELLDWVLRNTDSYKYYAHGAKSLEELDLVRTRRAEMRKANILRDLQRQAGDKQRIAAKATRDLPNAVRRGDIKAVHALIGKGADVRGGDGDGESLVVKAELQLRGNCTSPTRG